MMSNIIDCEPKSLVIGMNVEVTFENWSETMSFQSFVLNIEEKMNNVLIHSFILEKKVDITSSLEFYFNIKRGINMKALVLTEFGKKMEVQEVPKPTLTDTGIIIRVKANGICRSDWHFMMGDWDWIGLEVNLPHVFGHEFSGVVEQVGSQVTKYKKGDRVVVPHAHGEGTCEYCLTGHSNICDHGNMTQDKNLLGWLWRIC